MRTPKIPDVGAALLSLTIVALQTTPTTLASNASEWWSFLWSEPLNGWLQNAVVISFMLLVIWSSYIDSSTAHSPMSGPIASGPVYNASVYNVKSHQQSGGVTAGQVTISAQQVNMGAQQREIDDVLKSKILQGLPKGRKIAITAVMGDVEGMRFAQQILDFMRDNHFDVEGVNQAVYSTPIVGLYCYIDSDPIDFRVGSRA